jgi:iron(II)-dependent oxidoreductase
MPAQTPDTLFTAQMVVQHEQQHDETMLATLQLRQGAPVLIPGPLPSGRRLETDRVLVPGGPFGLGVDTDDEPASLDNERPAHLVDVPPFRIGRVPITNRQWRAFIADGGYDRPALWSDAGWRHRVEADLRRPKFWSPDADAVLRFGAYQALKEDEPVQHVCCYEAEAFAAWAGGRLPTEIEWEKACAWDPVTGRRRRWPWGDTGPTSAHANLGGAALRPAPVGAYPAGASAYGVEQMIGDVWEWTSSSFRPWPGFRPMLYRQYSEPFFGADYRVLRGGSWAVAPAAIRPSFRNWDYPIRRQVFSGVRVAWDV